MTRLERALVRIDADLRQVNVPFALIGGLAVSVRAEPRTTRDVDLALVVESDRDAENAVRLLLARGYRIEQQLEQTRTHRLATVRLITPEATRGIAIDLLFASSGIEEELVDSAELLEILPDLWMRVARAAHLLALKILAGRPHDLVDARALLVRLDSADIALARSLLDLIARRGFDRGRDLQASLDRLLREVAETGSGG